MALLPKKLYQGQPGVTTSTLYTASATAGHWTIVRSIIIANTDSAAHYLTLNHIPSGGTAGVGNQIFPNAQIPANSIVTLDSIFVMGVSEFIQGLADAASKITVTISGVEGP